MTRFSLRARRAWILFLLFLQLPMSGFAEQPQLKWDPVPGAGGYLIEIRTRDGKSVVNETLERPAYELSLDAGDYEMRITTLDKALKRGESTPWSSFKVQQILVPAPSLVVPSSVRTTEAKEFTIRGTGFSAGAEVMVLDQDKKEFRPSRRRTLSSSEIKVTFASALPPGTYSLMVQNPQGRKAGLSDVFTVLPPEEVAPVSAPPPPEPVHEVVTEPTPPEPPVGPVEPAKTGYAAGVGSSVAWALPPWDQLVSLSLLNVEVNGRMPFLPAFDAFAVVRYSGLSSPPGTDLVNLKMTSESLLVGVAYVAPWTIPARFRLGTGLAATQAMIDGVEMRTVNPVLTGGAGLSMDFSRWWEGEIGLESQVIFFSGTPLAQISLQWRASYLF